MSSVSSEPATAEPTGRRKSARTHGFVAASLGWMLDGFETYAVVLVGQQVVANLVGPDASPIYFGGILATTLFAWACGGLLSGVLADYIGRKRTLMVSIVWYAVFAGLTALADSYAMFIVLRFMTGLGMGAEWGPGSALVAELWSDKHRGRGIAFLQGSFGVGFLIATGVWALINTGPESWRWMFVIGVAPAFLALYVRRYVEDSDLWVHADERRRDARRRAAAGDELDASDAALNTLTIKQVFRDAAMRAQLLKLLVLALATLIGWWATSTWIPQYSAGIAAESGKDPPDFATWIALWFNVGGVLGYWSLGEMADRIGRKPTMFVWFLGALIMVPVLFLASSGPTDLAILAAVNGFFTLGLFTWMALYPVELFPTYARATAITVVFNLTRFIAAGAALLASWLVTVFGGIEAAAVVIGCIYILGVLFSLRAGPETRGKPLPA